MEYGIKNGIKYMDGNLIFNKDGECFAYYELIPYHYSCIGEEAKYAIHDAFRQLIASHMDGNIHMLQIATENSVRAIQEESKKEVKGNLKEIAYQRIDEQTEAIVDAVGEYQVEYRYFIGFKLINNQDEMSIGSIKRDIKEGFTSFIRDVNHQWMGDFVSMSDEEMQRFFSLEKLQESKIARKFKVRKIGKNDMGYIIEHLHGFSGVAYENYEYHLPILRKGKKSLIKKYDLLKPMRCLIKENQKHLKIIREDDTEVYVAYLTISSIVSELDFPSSEIFYYQQEQFDFPVDTSMNVEIVGNHKALSTVRNKKKELNDLDNHAWESDNDINNNVVEALEAVGELENNLDKTKESMYKLSYIVRVAASDRAELKRRCNEVRDFYDDMNIKLVSPFGDMLGLHHEFMPTAKRYINDYIQYVTSDFLSSLGFGATQALGEKIGIYMGYILSTGTNVYIKPYLAAQGVKGSITNALSISFTGSLGGGKSMASNLLLYYAVLFGAKAVIVDPKSERGNWKQDLADIAHEISIINISSDDKYKGLLDPYVIMQSKDDAKKLALDILTFLTGLSIRDGKKFPVLNRAVEEIGKRDKCGLLCVIDELRKDGSATAVSIADHIEAFTNYDFAKLLFSDGKVKNSIHFDKQLNIIQIAGLTMPEQGTKIEDYSAMEMLSTAILIAVGSFAVDFMHGDRGVYKIYDSEEHWSYSNTQQGKSLTDKLVRAGRSMNSSIYFVTQNCDDLTDEKVKSHIGLKFAFRSRDINEVKKTLEFFGLDKEDESLHKLLMNLDNGQCLFQDLYGNVGVIQIDPVFQELFDTFDTRPPMTGG